MCLVTWRKYNYLTTGPMAWRCWFCIPTSLGIVCSHCFGVSSWSNAMCCMFLQHGSTHCGLDLMHFGAWLDTFRPLIRHILALIRCIAALDPTNFGPCFHIFFFIRHPWFDTCRLLIRNSWALELTHLGSWIDTLWLFIRHISALDSMHFSAWFDTFWLLIRHISTLDWTHFGSWFETVGPLNRHIVALDWDFWLLTQHISAFGMTHFGPLIRRIGLIRHSGYLHSFNNLHTHISSADLHVNMISFLVYLTFMITTHKLGARLKWCNRSNVFGTRPLPEPMLSYSNSGLREKSSGIWKKNSNIFNQKIKLFMFGNDVR